MKNAEMFSSKNLPSISDSDSRANSSCNMRTVRENHKIRQDFSPEIARAKKESKLSSVETRLFSTTGRMNYCKKFCKILENKGSLPILFAQTNSPRA